MSHSFESAVRRPITASGQKLEASRRLCRTGPNLHTQNSHDQNMPSETEGDAVEDIITTAELEDAAVRLAGAASGSHTGTGTGKRRADTDTDEDMEGDEDHKPQFKRLKSTDSWVCTCWLPTEAAL